MKLIKTNRPDGSGLAKNYNSPRSIATRKRYGSASEMLAKFGVDKQRYCVSNYNRSYEYPLLVDILTAYGEQTATSLLYDHITDAVLRMGEDEKLDNRDVLSIAEQIVQTDRYRLLSLATLLKFFHDLKGGNPEIFGRVTPYRIMSALNKRYAELKAMQERVEDAHEAQIKATERTEHESKVISAEDYLKRLGRTETSLSEYLMNMLNE